jgi:transcriptional regulator with XRE-family HTH domain
MAGTRLVPEGRRPAATAEPLDLSNLGPALRHLRLTRELTQLDVAQRASVTKAMISGYETAGRLPSVRTLARLLGALDTDFQGLHEAMETVGEKRGGTDEGTDAPAPAQLTPPAGSP